MAEPMKTVEEALSCWNALGAECPHIANPCERLQCRACFVDVIAAALREREAQAYEHAADTAKEHVRGSCGCGHMHSDRCHGRDEGHEDAADAIRYAMSKLAEAARGARAAGVEVGEGKP